MKPVSNPRKNWHMRNTIRAALIAATTLVATPSLAGVREFYHSGVWSMFAGKTTDGAQMCGMSVRGGGRYLLVKYLRGDAKLVIQLYKASWQFQDGKPVTVRIQFDRAAPIQAVARGVHAGNMAGLEFYIGEDTVRDFSALFQRAVGAQVTFPGTDEAP
jgi:hypothetical protein